MLINPVQQPLIRLAGLSSNVTGYFTFQACIDPSELTAAVLSTTDSNEAVGVRYNSIAVPTGCTFSILGPVID